MSRGSISMTSDVTIELDIDDDSGDETDIYPDAFAEEYDDEVIIDPPIMLSQVICKVPSSVQIKDLSKEVRDFIQQNLDFPPVVSIGSWATVHSFLDGGEQKDKRVGKDFFKPYYNMHAQILLNALAHAERIDILAKLRTIIESGNYLLKARESENSQTATRALANDNNFNSPPVRAPEEKLGWDKTILVVHYEKTDKEKKDFAWFMQNMRRNFREQGGLRAMDVERMEKNDEGNNLKKLEKVYYKIPHIIVCFNEAYCRALCAEEMEKDFEFKKHIHDKAMIEFLNNGSNNYRFRPVLMPGTKTIHRSDWASVTLKYEFPKDFEALLKRVYEPSKRARVDDNQSNSSITENGQINATPPPLNN
uniref:Uncharacterized protein n=1 Tax=Caenorhabditis japonica TaxID=281687 RepID=A0A8R1DQC2_CAEJA